MLQGTEREIYCGEEVAEDAGETGAGESGVEVEPTEGGGETGVVEAVEGAGLSTFLKYRSRLDWTDMILFSLKISL